MLLLLRGEGCQGVSGPHEGGAMRAERLLVSEHLARLLGLTDGCG